MAEKKRLLIAVPVAPGGSIHVELWRWLTAVEVEATMARYLATLHGLCDDFKTRLELNRIRKVLGGSWLSRQARLTWSPKVTVQSIQAAGAMFPENWDVECIVHPGRPIPTNRNDIGRKSLYTPDYEAAVDGDTMLVPTDFDAVLMVDSDIAPDHHHLHLICQALDKPEVDAVSGVYCMVNEEDGVPIPVVYEQTGPGPWRDRPGKSASLLLMDGPPLRTAEGIGVPAGFLAIKRYALEELVRQDRLWFKDRFHDGSIEAFEVKAILKEGEADPVKALAHLRSLDEHVSKKDWGHQTTFGGWAFGEDIWFCRMMQEAGLKLWVDRRISLRHFHDVDLRQVHRMGGDRHFEGMMRAWGLDPAVPEQLADGRARFSAMMEEQAKKRDAEMREVSKAVKALPKLQLVKETP